MLRKSGDRLIVQKNDETLLDVQCHKIDAVMIFGNIQFTTQAVYELFEHGIEMALLTRTGRLIGQITSPMTKNISLRLEQFKKYWDDDFRLGLSKSIVRGKIQNSLNFIRIFSYNHSEIDFSAATSALNTSLGKISAADNLERLMGIEGSAAKDYFAAFGKMILGGFEFKGRIKRPPTDPVNAMLSLSYTMIFNEISSILDGLGFDPYLGYFHSVDYGRPSLAADLIEEFRAPAADRLTLYLVNQKIFKPEDFHQNPKGGGIYFRRDALKRYFVEYEQMLNKEFLYPITQERTTLRKCFRLQAEKMAAAIQHGNPYIPYSLEV